MRLRDWLWWTVCMAVAVWALLALLLAPLPKGTAMDIHDQERGLPASVIAEQVRLYDDAAQRINQTLARAIARLADAAPDSREAYTAGQQTIRAAQMQAEIDGILRRLGRTSSGLDEATATAVRRAIAEGESQLRELGLKPTERIGGVAGPSFGLVDRGAVEAIAADTVAKASSDIAGSMARALQHQGRAAGDLFRRLSQATLADGRSLLTESATNRAIARGLITGNPREALGAMREIFRDPNAPEVESYRRLGNKIIAVGAADMSVRAYASLVVRTRTREATIAARHERLGASGISLVQISGRVSENFCTAFIGLVCSLSGAQVIDGVRYPSIGDLPGGGPPFHPNCTKGTAAYVPDLVSDGRSRRHDRAVIEFETRQRQDRLLAPVRA